MNVNSYNKAIDDQINQCREILRAKHEEYAEAPEKENSDHLSNFHNCARILQTEVKKAWLGMFVKHLESLIKLIRQDFDEENPVWDEKITDSINYLLLLKALISETREMHVGMMIPSYGAQRVLNDIQKGGQDNGNNVDNL